MTDQDTRHPLLADLTWQPHRLEQDRVEKLAALLDQGVTPYPPRIQRTHTSAEALAAYDAHIANGGTDDDAPTVTVVGRIRRANVTGKIAFAHIEDGEGRIQLFLRVNDLGEAAFALLKDKLIEIDDFVQATGTLMRTKAGEISVRVAAVVLLSKSLSPLPLVKEKHNEDGTVEEYGEFTNVEARYRQRYADLAVNKAVRDVFRKRSQTFSAVRRFMDNEGFLEVETPILQPIYGGAAARPFITHHNAIDQDLYLRISFELYLKRLLVGGYEAVYEIGRDFRNEGVSFKHNPEFTQIEFYKAYIDYSGVMDIVERMVAYAAEQVTGSTTISYQGETISLAPPWKRITLRDAIRDGSGIDYMDTLTSEALEAAIIAKGDKVKPGQAWGQLIDHLLSTYVEPFLRQPTFLTNYPRDISPFAKRVVGDDFHVERFEMFMVGMELGNAFTELNDPLDQEARFLDMAKMYKAGSDEETPLDEDYLRAMRYGMPPNGGFGMGLDRLVMLLTDQRTIREVLLFPHLREE
ncbi:MAG: lysine--tRNA ligase [Phototrophicaceae bacterium]|jgi:lysyl-tRNA synthetase class 2